MSRKNDEMKRKEERFEEERVLNLKISQFENLKIISKLISLSR